VKILLDENLDWRLQRDPPGHEVKSVPLVGWAGLKNGALLSQAEKEFDVLLTMDSNMAHQQNLANYRIAIIALKAKTNRLADTRPLMTKVLAILSTSKAGTLIVIS
jgi:predicted nuclease of predicted toxin-antitoxin system